MKAKLFQNKIYVKKSSIHGYGVFADKDIDKDEIIEECYLLLTKTQDPWLDNYYFAAEDDSSFGLPAGFGVLYNHSAHPNAHFSYCSEKKLLIFEALRLIKEGEEILTSYGKDWFSQRKMQVNKPSLWYRLTHNRICRAFFVCSLFFSSLYTAKYCLIYF